MNDPRSTRLAQVIVKHSLQVQPGEVVVVEAIDLVEGLPSDLVEAIHEAGGIPLLYLRSQALLRQLLVHGNPKQIELRAEVQMFQLRKAQAYVALRAPGNGSELAA